MNSCRSRSENQAHAEKSFRNALRRNASGKASHRATGKPSPPPRRNQMADKDDAVQDAVGKFAIQVEKMLLAKLDRTWAPSGFSIETLINDLASRSAPPPRAGAPREVEALNAIWQYGADTLSGRTDG